MVPSVSLARPESREGAGAHALAVLVAAGSARRMGAAGPRKPFLDLAGATVLERACAALSAAASVVEVVIVAHADDLELARGLVRDRPAFAKVSAVLPGGARRVDSVRRGAAYPPRAPAELVCVHDAARPLVSTAAVERVLSAAARDGAALLALPVRDTLQHSADGAHAVRTVERGPLWAAQTPQVFERERFLACLERAAREDLDATDDAALWERYVGPVTLVPGERSNLKITDPEDLELARALLGVPGTHGASDMRIGTGFDVHRLVPGRPCVLGGIELPHPTGPLGHSDGDAVLHALADALLGAAGLDDLGTLFPDSAAEHAGASSRAFLTDVVQRVRARGFRVANADLVIATEGPRIAPHRAAMRAAIAELLGVEVERVNLKGKSLEGLGALAGGAGVAVQAVCLLER
jgi:2-C-methyl-D-erythritol 4-phosphate cytidylyltransferase/2-C-methyl-D-erythritol 2,4-cyclodiphosphate synthase